eukprot:TRINITY_DN1080_c0_g1_i1.p1 TRINITY_DN1080_c0_g1~~TRINITY_DN1080_c0_g1_i1.p1  ORF type:complete len:671 (+),score=119.65 TRINITY_DN1080_c0_g1_i1:72-2015(+)
MSELEGLERLLPVVNQLQDVFSKVNMVHELDLPQIVVVGAQSTGKSSVLENIVGKDFLPRGSGIVTRRPLVLQMTKLSADDEDQRRARGDPVEWGTFLHLPGQIFTDFNVIKDEISRETERLCGDRKGVSSDPIRLNVTSPNCLDLTVIDLPGLTKIAVDGQQENIKEAIEDMAIEYCKPKNTIILAVTAANTDIANSDALQLARRVDPQGDRTIGVLTKLDLMDAGTNALDVLKGNVVKLKRGFIGLVNRSQRDIDNLKNVQDSLTAEMEFFRNHPVYSKYASKQLGTKYLTQTLSDNLLVHIRKCLPELKQNIENLLKQTDMLLKEYGQNDMGPGSRLLQLLSSYSTGIIQNLDGSNVPGQLSNKIEKTRGGAKINSMCTTAFVPHLEKLAPLDAIDDDQVQTIISSCQGTRNKLFIPEQAFEALCRICIRSLESPSYKLVDLVHEELVNLTEDASESLSRYPKLQSSVSDYMKVFLLEYKEPLTAFVGNLMEMETAHINTNHPEFYNGGSIDSLIVSWTQSKSDDSPQAAQLPTADDMEYTGVVDPKSQREMEIIRELVSTYFKIVKKHMQDHVPKAIIHFLVNKTKENINTRLVEEFYKEDLFETLLEEKDDITRRRMAAQEMACSLKEALKTLEKVKYFRLS